MIFLARFRTREFRSEFPKRKVKLAENGMFQDIPNLLSLSGFFFAKLTKLRQLFEKKRGTKVETEINFL